jgi:S1-C subfamily serine protease
LWAGTVLVLALAIYTLWDGIIEVVQSYVGGGGNSGVTAPPITSRPTRKDTDTKYDLWLADLDKAKRQAAQEHKDLLLQVAPRYDLNSLKRHLVPEHTSDLLSHSDDFRRRARAHFVLVQPQASWDPPRSARFSKSSVSELPLFILADAEGKPYAVAANLKIEPKEAVAQLARLRLTREKRDRLLEAAGDGKDEQKLRAAREALDFLDENELTGYYSSEIDKWAKSAAELDPKNAQLLNETFFEADFIRRLWHPEFEGQDEVVGQLDAWKKSHQFKDANRAAWLHFLAGTVYLRLKINDSAQRYFRAGLAYQPSNRYLIQLLSSFAASSRTGSAGSGFVVSKKGYLLTNAHVISEAGPHQVNLPNVESPILAEVVAKDEDRDIALLHFTPPAGINLTPLHVVGDRQVPRGERVAVLGFPLGDRVGAGLKLTTGVVSALPEPGNGFMIFLDAKVNPGNSGGPLCDASGNVVGMISAKTTKAFEGFNVETYGMAIPGNELETFLRKNLKDFQNGPATNSKPQTWEEVDRLVSPSVFMITTEAS